jgi:hypothetical protein
MKHSSAWPWRAFNVTMRVCGVLAALCGVGALVWVAVLVLHAPILTRFQGVATDRNLAAPLLMVGIWFLILGICVLRARTYRPDLGDAGILVDPLGVKLQRTLPSSRTWWTGDPTTAAISSLAAHAFTVQTRDKTPQRSRPASSFSGKSRKVVGVVLISLGLVGFAQVIYVHFDYSARMPRSPEPANGRVVPFYANHGLVYGTAEEQAYLRRVELLGGMGVLVAMVGMYIAGRAGRPVP